MPNSAPPKSIQPTQLPIYGLASSAKVISDGPMHYRFVRRIAPTPTPEAEP